MKLDSSKFKLAPYIILTALLFLYPADSAFSATPEEEISELKEQVKSLQGRIETLESQLKKPKEEKPAEQAKKSEDKEGPLPAMLAKAGTNLKISGRFAAGYLDSQENGSYSNGSFQMPEAKLRFDFSPDKINTIVMRMNLNNATFNNVDYLYIDSNNFLKFLEGTPFTLSSRLGRFKINYGEETLSNNMVDAALPTTSSANVSGNDEGWQLYGDIAPFIKWAFAIMNGNSGTGSDNENSKAFSGKLGVTPIKPLYLSASYYNSGDLLSASSEVSIAGLSSAPTNATNWRRSIWEIDARYDFGKGKNPLDPIVYSDSRAYIRLAYGRFADGAEDSNERGVQDRDGRYAFIEGLYNITPKLYGAYRYSIVDLDDGQIASLNGVNANRQARHSMGLGWRWSDKTILKGEYTINEEGNVPAGTGKKNDQITGIISSSF